ncbi:DUF4435 domain-containing protein [Fluviicola taffensis]|uniref:DUF4435 domain-containing protein n=1 Tax=Fluviicola taffensis TaxID=191579 RepID=UPI003137D093
MKKADISYQEKLNELRLDILHPNSRGINFVLLEGDTDIRLFRKFFDLEKCKVETIPGGNKKLEECVDTLVNIYPLVLGIRDSDFIKLNSLEYNETNMFLTDYHDIEITMLNFEPVLNSIIFEYSSKSQCQHLIFRDELIETISLIGFLKLLNDKEQLELCFKSGFQDLISFTNKSIDFEQYIERILSKSPNTILKNKEELKRRVIELKSTNPDLLQLTNGHDLLNAFAKYFREVENKNGINGDSLGSAIRIVFNKSLFEQTTLYSSLTEWQITNATQLF